MNFSEELATVVYDRDRYYNLYMHIIDKNGDIKFDASKFFLVYNFKNGRAIVQDKNMDYGIIDNTGKVIFGNFDN